MLNCRQVTSMASDYVDGALPWRARFQVRLHLFMCWMCRRYVNQLDLTRRALRHLAGRDASQQPPAALGETFRAWKAERDGSDRDPS